MNLFIVEDNALMLAQLLRLLEQQPRIRVVGTASTEQQAVDNILNLQPDALILDLSLTEGSGINVLKKIRAAGCGTRTLVLTNRINDSFRRACENFGICGFFDKSADVMRCLERLQSWLPPLTLNETRRLQALYSTQLLDTPEQKNFDDIAQLAATIATTPMACISLLDHDRQWFLAHHGLNIRETSRSIAFCAHTILQPDLLEVEDARQDARFALNPAVAGTFGLRFYAGMPLILSSGEAIGTLCVLDKEPRHLSPIQRHALQTLARSAVAEIELRRRVLHLEKEITLREQAEHHIQLLASRDPLTGLPNRTTFRDRLEQQLRQSHRNQTLMAVLFVDLDRFKPINDTLGHEIGDAALIAASERLAGTLRECDSVARLGGDEFGVILPELKDPMESLKVAAKLLTALQAPLSVQEQRLDIDASIGIALYPHHGRSAKPLLRSADLAMYAAKKHGGGRYELFHAALDLQAQATLTYKNELRRSISAGELRLMFQPQVDLATLAVRGLEALVRWQHPHLGLLTPDAFITLAEEHGLIRPLGAWVLNSALAQLAQWEAAGIRIERIAVNVSAMELDSDYPAHLAATLQQHGLPPSRLELEITESAMTLDGLEMLKILQDIRSTGVSIAVDDFGVGYSALGQLRKLPIDILKIDRCFISEITASAQDTAIVKAVTTMTRTLGLRTIAEGIETSRQLTLVAELGCDMAQGYLLAKPLPAEEVFTWMKKWADCPLDAGTESTLPD